MPRHRIAVPGGDYEGSSPDVITHHGIAETREGLLMTTDYMRIGASTVTMSPEFETDVVIAATASVSEGVVALTLHAADGGVLPAWTPGSHIDVVLPNGLTRQFSLCGPVEDRSQWRIGVLREPQSRGGSAFIHDEMSVGSAVRIRGPRNHFTLVDAQGYLFIGGGIGITPLLPMIAAVSARGASWRLVYGGRTRASMAFLDELRPYGDPVTVHPQDELGFLPLNELLDQPREDTAVYCCGPGPLLDAVETGCANWPVGALHIERFAPKALDPDAVNYEFEIELAESGLTLTVPPDRSILQVIRDAGVTVIASCEEGTCGTCETGVLSGVPEHRDSVLRPDEQGTCEFMMICVSRAKTPNLVLEL
jgi:ferredoxin-NADP reductase